MQINSWTDAIVQFFENEIKESELYKARESYENKLADFKVEKDQKKKSEQGNDVESRKQALLEIRKRNISDNIKSFVYSWVVANKSPYTVPEFNNLITKVTHPLKYSHSSDINYGISDGAEVDLEYLSTGAIRNREYDLTHHNGAIIQLVRLLGVSFNNEMIYDCVIGNDFIFLNDFNLPEGEKKIWESQFKSWVARKPIKTVGRAKQIYFPIPINQDEHSYHLLAVLHSSTLSYEIYKRVYVQRFSNINRDVKTQKEDFKYHSGVSTSYPNLASVEYGNGQPQNVSLLNTKASGMSYLLPCSPPKFKIDIKPPMQVKTVFDDRAFNKVRVKDTLTYMTDYLVRFSLIEKSVKSSEKNSG